MVSVLCELISRVIFVVVKTGKNIDLNNFLEIDKTNLTLSLLMCIIYLFYGAFQVWHWQYLRG